MSVFSCSWWDPVVINDAVFRLHSKGTATVLFAFSAYIVLQNWWLSSYGLTSCGPYLEGVMYTSAERAYCWTEGDFLEDMPQFHINTKDTKAENNKGVTYYQWVHIILLFQGIFFFIPYWLWECFEGGLVRSITNGLRGNSRTAEDRIDKQSRVVKYLKRNQNGHTPYVILYIFCNLLSFVNIISQISYMALLPESAAVPNNGIDDKNYYASNPWLKVFPRIINCSLPVMTEDDRVIVRRNVMCILPYNVVSERIFYYINTWLIVLTVITCIYLMYLVAFMIVPQFRALILQKSLRLNEHEILLTWMRGLSGGDCFLLSLLGANVDSVTLQEILDETVTGNKDGGKLSEQGEYQPT